MMKKIVPIEELNHHVDHLVEYVHKMKLGLDYIPNTAWANKGTLMRSLLESRHGDKHLKNFLSAVEKHDQKKASYHITKLKKSVKPVRNDYPFEVGDMISVTRDEHNYEPGYVAVVKEVKVRNGIYSYVAQVVEDENGKVDKRFSIDIRHTRDAYKIS